MGLLRSKEQGQFRRPLKKQNYPQRQKVRFIRDSRGWLVREFTCLHCGRWYNYEVRKQKRCSACAGARSAQ